MPGSSPTIARREPARRLNNVDLPTFGRPTMAMSGIEDIQSFGNTKGGRGARPTQELINILTLCLPVLSPRFLLLPVVHHSINSSGQVGYCRAPIPLTNFGAG